MGRRKMVLTVIVGAVLLISVIAGTYAFFTATVNDSTSDNITVTSGSLSLTLNDMDVTNLTTWNITPSDLSRTLYLRVTNNSPISVDARLLFRGLTNTYSEYLVYSVEEVTSGKVNLNPRNVLINQARVPASTSASNKTMVYKFNVSANTTQYYKLTIEYLYSETVNQSSDVGKKFYTGFGLEEGLSKSYETLSALNLTLGSGTPNFAFASPSSESNVCLYNGNIVGTGTTSSACENIYKIDGIAEGYYDYFDSNIFENVYVTPYSLVYIGEAEWDSSTNKCMFANNEMYTAWSLLEYLQGNIEAPYVYESACTSVYSANVDDQTVYATGIKNMGAGTFYSTYTENTNGIYEAEDDYGTSYYFRGNVTNNYVKFGKNSSNQDMYWRIVRINGDGSLRLIYDGTQTWVNGVSSTDRLVAYDVLFNNNYDDAKYVGYMYGGAAGVTSTSYAEATTNETNSTIKTYIDNWYVANIKNTGYEKYLSDEIFCNDRSLESMYQYSGYGNNETQYETFERLYWEINPTITPTLKCPQKNDAFTVSDTAKGNGSLTYPIGLLTADEVSYAGGSLYSENTSYYLYKGYNYWLNTANIYNYEGAFVFMTGQTALLDASVVYSGTWNEYEEMIDSSGVTPVINLSAQTAQSLIGNGTASTPYRLP